MAYEKIAYNSEFNKQNYYRPCIYFPKSYKEPLRNLANRYAGGSVSKFITDAVDEYIQKLGEKI